MGEKNIGAGDTEKYMNKPSSGEDEQAPSTQTGLPQFLPAPTSDTTLRRITELESKLARRDNEIALLRTEVESLKKELNTSNVKLEQLIRQQETAELKAEKVQLPKVRPDFNIDDFNNLIDQRMHQIIQYDKPTILTQIDISGKFKEIIKERFIREVGMRIRALPPRSMHTAIIIHERKAMKRGELYSFLHGGNGRITDDFYNELQTLDDARIAVYSKETGVIHWALGEYLKRELGSIYDENTIKQAEDYLASLLIPLS